ncbi:hypothetical protein M2G40_21255 [Vibrio vulnificus]|nr:hypothetical protein [Vibrio vulnificus]MCU8492603.1 hypothetical protein [Vibrio vulnificus]MCU8510321.1 hypothetical protein [Vibrio vulnificus]
MKVVCGNLVYTAFTP